MLEYEVVRKAEIPPRGKQVKAFEDGEWISLARTLQRIQPGECVRVLSEGRNISSLHASLWSACAAVGVRPAVCYRGQYIYAWKRKACEPEHKTAEPRACKCCASVFHPKNPRAVVCGKKCRLTYKAAIAASRRKHGRTDWGEVDNQLARKRAKITRRPRGWEADLECSLALASGG